MDFGAGPNGQELASIEIDYYVGITPTLGKWNFDIAAYYVAYPGAFDPDGEFDYVEIWTGVDRSFFNDKLKLTIYNYWSPEYFGETGNNDVLEFSYEWTFNKVWYFTPKLGGNVGHQWGDLSQGGYDYTYWSVALTLGFNEKPPLELEFATGILPISAASPARPRVWMHVTILSWGLSKRHSKISPKANSPQRSASPFLGPRIGWSRCDAASMSLWVINRHHMRWSGDVRFSQLLEPDLRRRQGRPGGVVSYVICDR